MVKTKQVLGLIEHQLSSRGAREPRRRLSKNKAPPKQMNNKANKAHSVTENKTENEAPLLGSPDPTEVERTPANQMDDSANGKEISFSSSERNPSLSLLAGSPSAPRGPQYLSDVPFHLRGLLCGRWSQQVSTTVIKLKDSSSQEAATGPPQSAPAANCWGLGSDLGGDPGEEPQ